MTVITTALIICHHKTRAKTAYTSLCTFIFLLVASFSFTSCDFGKAERALDKAVEEYETAVKEEKREAEKPLEFFQEMLEQFCVRFYNDCYDKRTYHLNSLIAENREVFEDRDEHGNVFKRRYTITGKHSFDGIVSAFNDKDFVAKVEAIGEDNYKVTFSVKKLNLLGEETDEDKTATRVMKFTMPSE